LNYTVRPGDTLNSIAARFGVSVQELISVNNIPYPYYIYEGQNIFIPSGQTPGSTPTQLRPPFLGEVDRRLDRLERQVGNIDRRVDRLEQRVNRLDERVDRLEGRPRPRTQP
jgi:spore germination protein YaaH